MKVKFNRLGIMTVLALCFLVAGIASAEGEDYETATFALTIAFALFSGIAYCVFNYLTSTKPGEFNVGRLVASVIFGLFLGGVIIYQGTPINEINWGLLAALFVAFQGAQMWINGLVDAIWRRFSGHAVLENLFKK